MHSGSHNLCDYYPKARTILRSNKSHMETTKKSSKFNVSFRICGYTKSAIIASGALSLLEGRERNVFIQKQR